METSPFKVSWDNPQLTTDELTRRLSYEWWYFDLSTDDGVEMVIIFSRKNPMYATHKASVHVEYADGEQKLRRVHNFAYDQLNWKEDDDDGVLTIGPNSMRVSGQTPEELTYHLTLDLPEVRANLTFTPRHNGFLPSNDGCYFADGTTASSRRSCVSFSAPSGQITGTVRMRTRERAVTGVGYHDHPWGTEHLLLTHQKWHWGRMATEDRAIMFADVTPAPGFQGALRFVYCGETNVFDPTVWTDVNIEGSAYRRDGLVGIKFPHTLKIDASDQHWETTFRGSRLYTPIYDRSSVELKALTGGKSLTGWAEYYLVKPRLRKLVFLASRMVAFFWRPFPFLGK